MSPPGLPGAGNFTYARLKAFTKQLHKLTTIFAAVGSRLISRPTLTNCL